MIICNKPFVFLLIPLTMGVYSSTFGQTFRRDAKKGINHAKFVKTPSTRLNVGVIASLMVSSRIDCTLECLGNKECYSINLETSVDGKRSCELLNTDKFRNVDKVVFNANFDHYNIKTPCTSNPCRHGSLFCRPIYNQDEYQCLCKAGFTGKHCDTEKWIPMTPSSVCFSARSDNYGAFTIPAPGKIFTFKLTYLSGHVNCAGGMSQYLSRWGCNWPGFTHTMGVYITDTHKTRLLPANDAYKKGGSDCNNNEYYNLPWATTEGEELRFDNFSSPLSVSTGQEYQVWFIEDLNGCSEIGNGGEKTCAEVYGLYE